MRQIATAAASSSAAEIASAVCVPGMKARNAARMSARRFASCRVSLGRADWPGPLRSLRWLQKFPLVPWGLPTSLTS